MVFILPAIMHTVKALNANYGEKENKMSNNIELTEEMINQINEAFSKGESITLSPPPKKKYEPKGGCYRVGLTGGVEEAGSLRESREAGRERKTKEQADQLAKLLNQTAMLHAWACDNGVNVNHISGRSNWGVVRHNGVAEAVYTTLCNHPGKTYMTEEGAKEAAKQINEGILVL